MEVKWKKTKHFIIASVAASMIITYTHQPAFALTESEPDEYTIQIMEWMEQGIDINHTELIEQVREYIAEHIDMNTFASLHIDRVQSELGIVVLSFTKLPEQEHLDAITSLAENPNLIQFREVSFTEQQLIDKQTEIDKDVFENNIFEDDGITVYHTGVDVINNKVEIGIDPFTEQHAQIVYDRYGDDMIVVVQGYEMQLLHAGAATAQGSSTDEQTEQVDEAAMEANESSGNFFQKMLRSIASWFQRIF